MRAVRPRVAFTVMFVLSLFGASARAAGITPFSSAAPGADAPLPWTHQALPKVQRSNDFALVEDAGVTVLRIESDAAASTWVHAFEAPVEAARLSWRWKVSNAVAGSDFRHKAGDDYAARVYVLFDYPLEKLGFGDRFKISLARTLHGAELPTAAIAYVWGTAQDVGESGPNPWACSHLRWRIAWVCMGVPARRAKQSMAIPLTMSATPPARPYRPTRRA